MKSNERFRFERIEVWQIARRFNRAIFQVTRNFPSDERQGLGLQIRLASMSISASIAQGSGRASDLDFSNSLEVAYGSLMETVSHLYLAHDEALLTTSDFDALTAEAHRIAFKIIALSKYLGRKPRAQPPNP